VADLVRKPAASRAGARRPGGEGDAVVGGGAGE
jgi:hypothetical protein